MNVANRITLVRIILAVIIIVIMLFPFYQVGIMFPQYIVKEQLLIDSKYIIAGIIFVIAALTDFLDGYLARKYNMVTDFGKLMDAIADKILVNSVLIAFAAIGFISPLLPIIIVIRDAIVNSIKMLAASKGKVIAAINLGKVKTICMMVGLTLTFFYNLPFVLWNFKVADFLLITATILALISGIQYLIMNKELLQKKD